MSDFSISSMLDDDKLVSLQNFSENLPTNRISAENSKTKREIVSKIAFLIGIDDKYFGVGQGQIENMTPQFYRSIYDELNQDREARIVRNLCRLRTKLQRNFKAILTEMNSDIKNIDAIPDLVPQDALQGLEEDGINFVRARRRLDEYIVDVHNYLLPHVPNCQKFLPEWIKWPYIRNLFFINKGSTIEGNKEAARLYSEFRDLFPYQSFINWSPDESDGNILRDDAKFLPILYERNRDKFYDMSKVTEAGDAAITDPEDFFVNSGRIIIAVDCENADPCKVIGIMKDLDARGMIDKVAKILLVDDEHTSAQWRALRRNENLPLEYYLTDRVKDEKSAVDVALTIKFYREIAQSIADGRPIDAAIIISSDCDFWPLIELTPEIKFLVMLEYDNCSQAYYQRLQNNNIQFFYIDEFFTAGNLELKTEAVLQEVIHEIEENHLAKLNLFSVITRALSKLDLKMNDAEVSLFIEKYIAGMTVGFAKNGSAVLRNKPVLKY
ncbi:MAG: hypothetical protein SPL10_08605 [Synergistales bacterium]|nr:hypothetical protein [Synergistales bacterium]MDY6401829.1 hypothetical protein [Synergistales bacterium]MDY6403843.1 hypothetical protein [Synergistales bacterium]MDY6410139.1 hypothetical protein [Synergistales bacterium]MDY6415197.1 hypothetical protein [Synergistales bacterium]